SLLAGRGPELVAVDVVEGEARPVVDALIRFEGRACAVRAIVGKVEADDVLRSRIRLHCVHLEVGSGERRSGGESEDGSDSGLGNDRHEELPFAKDGRWEAPG